MTEPKKYLVNEIYYTIQGEGRRFGIPHVFVRMSRCNLTCNFCDTEFESGVVMTAKEIVEECRKAAHVDPPAPELEVEGARRKYTPALVPGKPCRNVLFCGGEPMLQVDTELLAAFHDPEDEWFTVVETNGTRPTPVRGRDGEGFDWVTVSPKVAEHAMPITWAHEVKYVRAKNQGIPVPKIEALHYSISPMFEGLDVDPETLAWCVKLVQDNPQWELTIQHHKFSFNNMR